MEITERATDEYGAERMKQRTDIRRQRSEVRRRRAGDKGQKSDIDVSPVAAFLRSQGPPWERLSLMAPAIFLFDVQASHNRGQTSDVSFASGKSEIFFGPKRPKKQI